MTLIDESEATLATLSEILNSTDNGEGKNLFQLVVTFYINKVLGCIKQRIFFVLTRS